MFHNLRNKSSMKMARKRRRSGSAATSMLGTGRTTKRTASVFSTTRTAISMREDGWKIKGMAKELCGLPMERISSGDNTLAIGSVIERKVVGQCSSKQEIDTMGFGSRTGRTARDA